MSISPADLLAYSETLTASDELTRRNAVGRSYYAAYHTAEIWHEALVTHGVAPAGLGMHSSLIAALKNPSVSGAKRIRSMSLGYTLEIMKALRKTSDYKLNCNVPDTDVNQSIANARIILAKAV